MYCATCAMLTQLHANYQTTSQCNFINPKYFDLILSPAPGIGAFYWGWWEAGGKKAKKSITEALHSRAERKEENTGANKGIDLWSLLRRIELGTLDL